MLSCLSEKQMTDKKTQKMTVGRLENTVNPQDLRKLRETDTHLQEMVSYLPGKRLLGCPGKLRNSL